MLYPGSVVPLAMFCLDITLIKSTDIKLKKVTLCVHWRRLRVGTYTYTYSCLAAKEMMVHSAFLDLRIIFGVHKKQGPSFVKHFLAHQVNFCIPKITSKIEIKWWEEKITNFPISFLWRISQTLLFPLSCFFLLENTTNSTGDGVADCSSNHWRWESWYSAACP